MYNKAQQNGNKCNKCERAFLMENTGAFYSLGGTLMMIKACADHLRVIINALNGVKAKGEAG